MLFNQFLTTRFRGRRFRRAGVAAVLIAAFLVGGLLPVVAQEPVGRVDQEGSGDPASQSRGAQLRARATGESTWRTDPEIACSFSDIPFAIDVTAEPTQITDPKLTMRVWDVDYNDPQGCEGGAEVDNVHQSSLSGKVIGTLTGANNSWSTNVFPLSAGDLVSGTNRFTIDTDAPGTGCWCVGLSWAEISAKVGFQVTDVTPTDNAKNIDFDASNVTATFSSTYDPATLTTSTFKLRYRDRSGTLQDVAGTIEHTTPTKATFKPSAKLKDGILYRAEIVAGAAGVKSTSGGELQAGHTWSFWTMVDLDGQTTATFAPSTTKDRLEPVVFQVSRDAKLIPTKKTVTRVYARWEEKSDVHPDDQVTEFQADVTVTAGGSSHAHPGNPVTLKRPDKYTAAEKKSASNSANVYHDVDGAGGNYDVKATVEPKPQENATPRKFEKTKTATMHDKKPKISVPYRHLKIGVWSGGVPAANQTAANTLYTSGATFTNDQFPTISVSVTGGGEYNPLPAGATVTGLSGSIPITITDSGVNYDARVFVAWELWSALAPTMPSDAKLVMGTVPPGFLRGATGITYSWASGRRVLLIDPAIANEGTIAHEVGHGYALGHENSNAGIEGFRLSTKANKSVTEGNGEHANTDSLMHEVIKPFLSQWIDKTQYSSLFSTVTATAALRPAATGQYIVASGAISNTGISLQPFQVLTLTDPIPTSGTAYSLVQLDGSGTILSATGFDPVDPVAEVRGTSQPTETLTLRPFVAIVPLAAGVKTLELREGGSTGPILASVVRSNNTPVVTLTSPTTGSTLTGARTVSWTGSDADGDSLTYAIYYSADSGTTWQTIATGLAATSLAVDTRELLQSPNGRLRVTGTDGFNTGEATVNVDVANGVVVRGFDPGSGATGVSTTPLLQANFYNDLLPSDVTSSTFQLLLSSQPVNGTVTYIPETRTAQFVPTLPLETNRNYSARLASGIRDVYSNTLSSTTTWSFTTITDTVPPLVSFLSPAAGALDVPRNSLVSVGFDKALDSTTVSAGAITLAGPSGPVSGVITPTAGSRLVTFVPSTGLAANSVYTATLATGPKDTNGNALEAGRTWSFTTGSSVSTGVRFTGQFSDRATDTNNDGLSDDLTVSVQVEVLQSGTYNLNGRLVDSQGQSIEWTTTGNQRLTPGVYSLPLVYTGSVIRSHGVPGPYVLTELSFYHTSDPAIIATANDVYQTSTYDPASFFAAVTLTRLPDQRLNVGETRVPGFDLSAYAGVQSGSVLSLTYSIVASTVISAGVSISNAHFLAIVPATGWTGYSDVTVAATDGSNTARDTFRVSVAPHGVYLPSVTRAAIGGW